MKRFLLGMLLAIGLLAAVTALSDPIVTQAQLDEVHWGTRSMRALVPELLLKHDRAAHPAVPTVAALRTIPSNERYHGMTCPVLAGADGQAALYVFHGTSQAEGDNDTVVTPASGVGRWLRVDVSYTAGSGLTLTGGAFAVNWGGTGTATAAARADHHHDQTYLGLSGGSMTGGVRLDAGSVSAVWDTDHWVASLDKQAGRVLIDFTDHGLAAGAQVPLVLTNLALTEASIWYINATPTGSSTERIQAVRNSTGTWTGTVVLENGESTGTFTGTVAVHYLIANPEAVTP